MATNNKLRLVPVTGKFCQVTYQGKKYEIWRKLPGSPKELQGTAVPYDIAVQLLCLQPPVVALIPKIEDGKFVSQLSEKDLNAIKEAQQSGQVMISNAFNNVSDPTSKKDDSSAEVIAALKQQNEALQETINAQKSENAAFQEQLKALTAQVQTLTGKPAAEGEQKPASGSGKPAGK